jgi:hypothetical protein
MSDEVEMPSDWDEHAGWEAYFASLPSDEFWFNTATTSPGSFSFDRLGSLIDDFLSRDRRTLWFPGCGFSPLPRAFASFGFTVHATDIAPSAIHYQNNNESIVQPLLAGVTVENGRETGGCLKSQIHDFRTSFGAENVDAIFNIKSIQGLPRSSMSSAVRSHFAALRPGGIAFFDTMNVQGERRDQLEDALADAGFYIPLHALDKWYRKALADTGIPHMFVLGAPMIPQRDDYPYPHKRGSPEYDRDVQILRDLTTEYRSRMEPEYEQEQQSVDDKTKHAKVIYSTG